MSDEVKVTKRTFLRTVAAGAPTVKLMLEGTAAAAPPESQAEKFTPLDCSKLWNASGADLGPREGASALCTMSQRDKLIRTPGGRQFFRGVPFALGTGNSDRKSWIALSRPAKPWSAERIEIPVVGKASYLCLAQFCDWDKNEDPPPGQDIVEKAGQRLADAALVYEDGGRSTLPIRRRFEVTSLSVPWGHLCFAAAPHRKDVPAKLTDRLPNALQWGDLQLGVWEADYSGPPDRDYFGTLWICALENPKPELAIRSLLLEAQADDPLMVCGVTLYHGRENPLRYERLQLYRFTLPERNGKWEVEVDLGVVARTYRLPGFDPEAWLQSPAKGLSEPAKENTGANYLYVEVSASPDATLTLRNTESRQRFEWGLGQVQPGQEVQAHGGAARVTVIEREKTWVHGKVTDAATGRPTPARLSIRSKDGRYIPPYGHRTEINAGWFQDYGADIQWGDSSFAYVDGTFQVELPVGEVYVELSKGFEYEPVRRRATIEPGQRELNLELTRFADWRSKNWVTADTHVHFLSPSTAVLEGQAEGLNLINLLAAQWSGLFTNVGDLSHGPLKSSDGETMVWVGTENRQHILGHLGLLGGHGEPVFPMSASGPHESYIGDPLWNTLAEWADACRKREGLVVAVHFPYPTAELAADIVLGKIDAVELWPVSMTEQFNNLRFLDWYRYLNCGYRLPAVAGTDKMGAWIPAGAYRVYAHLGQEEFSFPNWAKAVRAGNTFMTSGPLLSFAADGKQPGGEIALGAGGGTIEVAAEVKSVTPVHRLDIVYNGVAVESVQEAGGAREMTLRRKIQVKGPGWLAARCASKIESAGTRIAAHTSPVYVTVPGQDVFSAPAAAYMLTLIDGAETWAKNLATRPDAERFAKVLKTFAEARERLHRRMHEHGAAH